MREALIGTTWHQAPPFRKPFPVHFHFPPTMQSSWHCCSFYG